MLEDDGLDLDEPIENLTALFTRRGALSYGENVTQLEHALQCAELAAAEQVSPALITAALLHDVGHLLHRDAAGALAAGVDDGHERLGASYLAAWFGEEVAQPIALHVEAKRYLCHADPGYVRGLSPVSLATLELQGSAMRADEARAFAARRHALAAVRLRRWDDAGKQVARSTRSLRHYLDIAASCLRR